MSQVTAIALEKESNCLPEDQRYQVVEVPSNCRLPAIVSNIIEYFNGQRTLAEVCRKGQISVSRGQAIVRKLTGMGILETAPNVTFVSESPAFTPEEEAFFQSEVEPIDECDEPFESYGEKLSLFISEMILRLRGNPVF